MFNENENLEKKCELFTAVKLSSISFDKTLFLKKRNWRKKKQKFKDVIDFEMKNYFLERRFDYYNNNKIN